jgi:hypothetical protein
MINMAGWHSIAAAFRSCFALGWSPLPLAPETKRPPLKSWPARCVVSLTGEDLQRLYRPGHEIGVACGYGGLVIADVDRGADPARKLLCERWGPPHAVVLGGRPDAFKAIYKGPWADPPPELVRAALDYATAGQMLARAEHHKRKAAHLAGSMTLIEAEQARAHAARKQAVAKLKFDALQDAWIDAHQMIRSEDVSGDEIAMQILSFGRQAVLPPSRHTDGVHTYRWEGEPPTRARWESDNA